VVATNGVEARQRAHLGGALPVPLRSKHRYLLYVGSAHPPNLTGFRRVMPHVLEALRPDERIVAAGGVAHLIYSWLYREGPAHLARDRLVLLPDVTDLALDALIHNASGIVLPMDSGGGSNLKTAEALHSGLPMVATRTAMRGYEAFTDMDGVLIAESPQEFSTAIRRVFDDPPRRREPSPRLDSLLWSHTLRPLVELVAELAAEIDR
jgi:glycosyltransferase involved in cell wall biosynthesis